jgi:hypothetical protein
VNLQVLQDSGLVFVFPFLIPRAERVWVRTGKICSEHNKLDISLQHNRKLNSAHSSHQILCPLVSPFLIRLPRVGLQLEGMRRQLVLFLCHYNPACRLLECNKKELSNACNETAWLTRTEYEFVCSILQMRKNSYLTLKNSGHSYVFLTTKCKI